MFRANAKSKELQSKSASAVDARFCPVEHRQTQCISDVQKNGEFSKRKNTLPTTALGSDYGSSSEPTSSLGLK